MIIDSLIEELQKLRKGVEVKVVVTDDNDALWSIQKITQDEHGMVYIEAGWTK